MLNDTVDGCEIMKQEQNSVKKVNQKKKFLFQINVNKIIDIKNIITQIKKISVDVLISKKELVDLKRDLRQSPRINTEEYLEMKDTDKNLRDGKDT